MDYNFFMRMKRKIKSLRFWDSLKETEFLCDSLSLEFLFLESIQMPERSMY